MRKVNWGDRRGSQKCGVPVVRIQSPSSGKSANFRFLSVEAASRTAAVINAAPRLRAANSCETMYQVAQVYRFREFLTGQLLATFLDLLTLAGLCHGNSIEHALRPKTPTRHAAATASCHCAVASARKIRSVDREMRWR